MIVDFKLSPEDIEAIATAVAGKLRNPEGAGTAEDLIPREDYAALMKVTPQTVSKQFEKGLLRGKKQGRRLYIYKNQHNENTGIN